MCVCVCIYQRKLIALGLPTKCINGRLMLTFTLFISLKHHVFVAISCVLHTVHSYALHNMDICINDQVYNSY